MHAAYEDRERIALEVVPYAHLSNLKLSFRLDPVFSRSAFVYYL